MTLIHQKASLRENGFSVLDSPRSIRKGILLAYDTFVLDCDGVLWAGSRLLPGVREAMHLLRSLGKCIFFVTNNSTKSRRQYVETFLRFGMPVSEREVIPASFATARYLRQECPKVGKVYLIGGAGLEEELRLVGIEVVRADTHRKADTNTENPVLTSEEDFVNLSERLVEGVDAVICGWDLHIDAYKLGLASHYLQKDPAVPFIATNCDLYDDVNGMKIPGNGATVAYLENVTGRRATLVGKPSQWLATWLFQSLIPKGSNPLVIGDRLDTDIRLGHVGGVHSAAVMTGVTSESQFQEIGTKHPASPTWILPSFGTLSKCADCFNVDVEEKPQSSPTAA